MNRLKTRVLCLVCCGCWYALACPPAWSQNQPAPPRPVPAVPQPDGQLPPAGQDPSFAATPGSGAQGSIEPLTRGPVHEGFAEMAELTPQPTRPVPGQPPQPINELPADVRPDSPDAEWLPGYWGWDTDRKGFIWISGVWRIPPPGSRWVPGYWTVGDSGAQRVPGFWQPADVQQISYLPAPPAYEDEGVEPASPPTPDVFWIPGYWAYLNHNYAWQPGYWARSVPGWMWMAAHYAWTPSGYVFVDGRWDFPLEQRGMLFAPVAFVNPLYQQNAFVYSPASVIDLAMLSQNLFVNPAFQDYCFGDYYANQYQQAGIYPWYSVGTGAYLYDPIFAYRSWYDGRRNPRWRDELRQRYDRLVKNPALRPPRTWRDEQRLARAGTRPGGYRPMVMPIQDALRGGKGFVRVNEAERREARQNTDVRRRLALDRGQVERRAGEVRPEVTPGARPPERAPGFRPEGRPTAEGRPAIAPPRTLRLPPARTLAARPGTVERERPPADRERIPKAPAVRPNEEPRTEPRPKVEERPREAVNETRNRQVEARPAPPPRRPERVMQARPKAPPPARRPAPARPERKP